MVIFAKFRFRPSSWKRQYCTCHEINSIAEGSNQKLISFEMGFQHRFNVIHLLLSFVKLYSQFNIVWISQTHSSFERRYFIFPKLLNIIEAEPSEEFLKSKLLSAYLFEWFVKNSVGILSIKMYLASLQTFYVQEIFLIITGHYLSEPHAKKWRVPKTKMVNRVFEV